jgi:hypothetical protein
VKASQESPPHSALTHCCAHEIKVKAQVQCGEGAPHKGVPRQGLVDEGGSQVKAAQGEEGVGAEQGLGCGSFAAWYCG